MNRPNRKFSTYSGVAIVILRSDITVASFMNIHLPANMATKSILKPNPPEERMVIPSTNNVKKNVHWGDMTVFEFPNQLGDNPAVSGGAPLTIGWNHENVNVVTIEYNEFIRSKQPRRKRKDLMLSSAQRDTVSLHCITTETRIANKCSLILCLYIVSLYFTSQYLLGLGYSLQQLVHAAEEVRKIQKSRQAQVKTMKTWNKFKQVFEGATRSLGFGNPQEPKILVAKCG